jgi:hypothetical protein
MRHVVVAEDALCPAIAADALDHRGVVQLVGIDDEPGEELRQGRERRVIGDVGGGEDERRLLAVQIGKLRLQPLVIDRGPGNVARPARARAGGFQRLVHRLQHDGVLAHAEVIVAAPDGDFLLRAVGLLPDRVGELALLALDIDEGPVAALFVQTVDGCVERVVVVHWLSPFPRPRACPPLRPVKTLAFPVYSKSRTANGTCSISGPKDIGRGSGWAKVQIAARQTLT